VEKVNFAVISRLRAGIQWVGEDTIVIARKPPGMAEAIQRRGDTTNFKLLTDRLTADPLTTDCY